VSNFVEKMDFSIVQKKNRSIFATLLQGKVVNG